MRKKGVSQDQWNKWVEWHKDWIYRRDESFREAKRYKGYAIGEKQEKLLQIRKEFMREFWVTRKLILGY